jgi:putative DNA primase/helicase
MKGNIWVQVLNRIQVSLRRHEFMEWLQPTSLASDDGHALEIRVSDENVGKYIRKHYLTAIAEALTAYGRQGVEVNFVVGPPVTDTRATRSMKGPQGKALEFEVMESWEQDVDGAALLTDLATAFERFITLPPHAATALALWVMHTYTHEAAFFSPVIAITSPIKGCGKTSVLIVMGSLVHRRQFASNLTSAVLFRLVDRFQPTLLIDEADTFLPENDQLRGLLNSGHTKATAWLIRNVGEDYDPRKFHTWCPKAIASIGRLPGTLEDRSIQIRMRRQRSGDEGYRAERLRIDHIDGWHLPLRQRAARWADDHLDGLRQRDPEVPRALADRPADCWRPLFAIADESGGEWPQRARQAAEALSGEAFNDDQEPGVELLRDLIGLLYSPTDQPDAKPLLAADTDGIVPTADIVKTLAELPDRPWSTWRGEKPITPYALSKLLRPLSVYPTGVRRMGRDQAVRGYRREAFDDAFSRYLPFQLIGCCNANVYGPKSQLVVDRNEAVRSTEKSENNPVNIGSATPDQPLGWKRGVIPLIPTLKGSLARAKLKSVLPHPIPSRTSSASRGKAK